MAASDGTWTGTVLVGGAVAAAGWALAHFAYEWSAPRIAAHERAAVAAQLGSVLDPALRGRSLVTTRLSATDAALLGSAAAHDVFVVVDGATPVATVLAVVAPGGYNGPIDLLVGIAPNGEVTGVRTTRHRETRGLGDAIDAARGTWLAQFARRSLREPDHSLWALRADDGAFDAIAGATVTSRAVVTAVRDTLVYFAEHREELYARAAATLADDDDP